MSLITGLAERIEDGGPHELDHKVVGFRPTGRVRSDRRPSAYSEALSTASKGQASLLR